MTSCKEKFAHETDYAAILIKLMNRKEEQLKWLYNIKSFYDPEGNVFFFNEELRSDNDMVYFLFGENGEEHFTYQDCKNVFRNQLEENLVYMKDCGHYLMDEKPEETTQNVLKFLEDIDKKNSK